MKIAIISDIHDHIDNLRKALKKLSDAEVLLCCGDLCSPFIIKELGEGFMGKEIHIVFGNNDADLFRITTKAADYEKMKLHGELCELSLDNRKFAMNHFDNIGRALAKSDAYDVVCFGHNHEFEISQDGETLLINPGEIMGGLSGQSTCVIYDSSSGEAQKIDL